MKNKTYLTIIFVICLLNQVISMTQIPNHNINYPDTADIVWEQLYFPDSADIGCITTNEYGDIFIGTKGQNSGVYRSIDEGDSWDLIIDNNSTSVFAIETNNANDLYVGKGGIVELLKSYDNGDTWDTLNMPEYINGFISHVYCRGNDTVYLATWENGGGMLSRTVDDGLSWDSLFYSASAAGDHITDICVSSSGELFVTTMGFSNNTGGLFSSEDNGLTWNYRGLNNHQVAAMSINSNNDVFTGDWATMNNEEHSGIFALYNYSDTLEKKSGFSNVYDMDINSENQIFICYRGGVLSSIDNGETFIKVSNGIDAGFFDITIDLNGFVYISRYSELYRTVNPTVGGVDIPIERKQISVFPNPAKDYLSIKFNDNSYLNMESWVQIMDINYNVCFNSNMFISKNNIKLDIRSLSSGIYILKVKNRNYEYSTLFINQ